MSTQAQIEAVAWDQWIDTEWLYRYYSAMADRYRWRHTLGTIGLLAVGIGAGSAIVAAAPIWLGASLSFLVTVIAVALAVLGWARVSAEADSVSQQYRWLANEWRRVWWQRENSDVSARIAVLDAWTLAVPIVKINEDRALNKECHDEAIRVVQGEQAHAG